MIYVHSGKAKTQILALAIGRPQHRWRAWLTAEWSGMASDEIYFVAMNI